MRQQWDDYTSGTTTRDQVDYGYDYAGNRQTRDIPSSLYSANDRDQAYTYDGLHRLKTYDGGTLSGTSISTKKEAQDFTLDQLGNWSTFKQDGNGTWDLEQNRSHNDVNEVGTISNWVDPVGSMR